MQSSVNVPLEFRLTLKHRHALLLIAQGKTDEQIGRILKPDATYPVDVGKRASRFIRDVLDAPDRASAVALAFKHRLLTWNDKGELCAGIVKGAVNSERVS